MRNPTPRYSSAVLRYVLTNPLLFEKAPNRTGNRENVPVMVPKLCRPRHGSRGAKPPWQSSQISRPVSSAGKTAAALREESLSVDINAAGSQDEGQRQDTQAG